ncbi:helix-turn-helix domain-containing protein [Cohnella silvisoli]|uniref:Helix-turn-helix domain-containing protein n=1 Tax=Cohnella silvisoli TaxID=2873699 RepID=A0ABV1KXK6_9BACL|nr:helix-turn-helix domain-containing protein [Cohnella silvisoli]MCD9023719.1 AraC family transcriptional regulator [Cohnella silvisoli]
MRKTWYYRLLFSYMPVFFLIVSFLFFIFFQALSERAQQDTTRIYETIDSQAQQSVEQALQSIDYLMVNKQTNNITPGTFNLIDFFNQEGQPSPYFTYQANKEFNNMKQLNLLIHSIYLVRERDGYVLSANTVSLLDRFPDSKFVQGLLKENYSYHWTNKRSFKEFEASREEQVVTLVRKYITNLGESGLMVVNVKANSLYQLVSQRLDRSASYVDIIDGSGQSLFGEKEPQQDGRKAMATLESSYTGWTYESGLVDGSSFSLVRTFSNVWIILSILVVLLGIVTIIYMTNRNYKPLRSLIAQLDRISYAGRGQSEDNRNEFHYIQSTVDGLVERFNVFKSQSDQNIGYRKKSIFLEVMSGTGSLTNEEWQSEMDRHGFAGGFSKAAVIVLSIDKYKGIQTRFKEQDLILYQFIIQNAYTELVEKYGLRSWSEWINPKEMCGFIYVNDETQVELMNNLLQLTENALTWIRYNLPFTVTIGIGQLTDSVPNLKDSYKSAMEAINYKTVLGSDRTIGFWETEEGSKVELYHHLERIRGMVYAFRLMESDWRTKYAAIYQKIKENRLKQSDIVNLLNYLSFHLFENIQSIGMDEEVMETNKAIMKEVIDNFETLEDAQEELLGVLEKLEYIITEKTSKANSHLIAIEMKQYIEEHISNPDLSLAHLSQQFDISSKNVSHLFKDQLDINFIDFLIHRRVELAKQLLMDSNLSIQEVGHKVGYLNPVSFNRVFKRIVGVPPGDYRKERFG